MGICHHMDHPHHKGFKYRNFGWISVSKIQFIWISFLHTNFFTRCFCVSTSSCHRNKGIHESFTFVTRYVPNTKTKNFSYLHFKQNLLQKNRYTFNRLNSIFCFRCYTYTVFFKILSAFLIFQLLQTLSKFMQISKKLNLSILLTKKQSSLQIQLQLLNIY